MLKKTKVYDLEVRIRYAQHGLCLFTWSVEPDEGIWSVVYTMEIAG